MHAEAVTYAAMNRWDAFATTMLLELMNWVESRDPERLKMAAALSALRMEHRCDRRLYWQGAVASVYPVSRFVRNANISAEDDPLFLALDNWVTGGDHTTGTQRQLFLNLVNQRIGNGRHGA